jgi:hypothetical protein
MARFETPHDLLKKVEEIEQKHVNRKASHELDHRLWRLDTYVLDELKHNTLIKKENYPSFTSNAPRTLSRVVTAMLNKNKPLLEITIPLDATVEEEETVNNNERLVNGAFYETDRIRSHKGDTNLQWDITWFIIHRGGVVVRPLFTPGDRQKFKIAVYDPHECAWERGDDCLDFFVRHYEEERGTVESTWNKSGIKADSNDMVEVFDIWWIDREGAESKEVGEAKDEGDSHDVWNAVVTGKEFLKEPTKHEEFDCVPIYVNRAGGAPSNGSISFGAGTETGQLHTDGSADQWESIYTGVRETIGWMNRVVTLFGIYLRNGAIGPWIYKGRKNKTIEKALEPFKVAEIDVNEDFAPAGLPQMATEAKEFLEFVRQEWQKAGVSDIVFGDVPFTISGFGMVQLRGAVEILISHFIGATEQTYVNIADELTKQFVKLGGRRKLDIKGTDRRDKEFMAKIKPTDIQKEYITKVTLNEGLPKDPVQLGNAANLWRQAGVPSKKVFDDVFDFEDGQAVWDEGVREDAQRLPQVRLAQAVDLLLEQGKQAEAQLVLQLAMAAGGAGQQGQAGNLQAAPPAAGGGQPGEEGPPAEFQPPELQGDGETGGRLPQERTGRPPRAG